MGNEVSLSSKNPLNDSRSRTERLNRVLSESTTAFLRKSKSILTNTENSESTSKEVERSRALSFKAETTKALKISVYSFVDSQKEFSGFLSAYEQNKGVNTIISETQSGYSQTSAEIKNFVPSNNNNRGSGSNYKEAAVIEEEEPHSFSVSEIHYLLSQINTISPGDLELCLDNITLKNPMYKDQLYNILNSISKEYRLELGKPLYSNITSNNSNNNNVNHSDEHLDWNSKFQSLIELLQRSDSNSEERLAIYEDLSKLAQDFHETALTYGKLIISEVYVPLESKTIKPQAYLGGIVGGEKFLVKNILFKFATAESKEGLFSTNEAAAKVAGHDLKGLIQYFNLAVDLLHFPMMVLVDYLGFRLQALSWLPIDPNTIIYGSSDAGRTVHAENIKFSKRMKTTAEKLNVKAHEVGLTSKSSKLLYSCADLEGHLGKDGRFYLLDFSRAFPPFDNCQVTSDTSQSNPHLYRIFRPEFIKNYPIPLCSDTFSGFVANHNPKEHIQEIKEATQYLLYDLIPNYAKYLNTSQNNYSDMLTIKQSLHKRGINMYFMGILRGHISDIKVKKYLLIEMIARSVKHEINSRLRIKLKELRIALQRPLICHIVDYLNLVFGQSKESTVYWNTILKDKINLNYPHALSKVELDSSFDLKSHIDTFDDICLILKIISRFNLFKWSSLAEKEFTTNRHAFTYNKPIDETDIEDLCVHTKHIGLVSTSMGLYLKDKALMKTGANSTRLYEAAIEKFEEALLCSADKITMREIAHVYELLNMMNIAEKYYKDAIDTDTKDGINYFRYALFLDRNNRLEDADQYYLKSLELRPDDVVILKCYGEFLYRHNHKEEASKFFNLAKTYSKASSIKTDIIYENERRTVFGQAFSKSNLLMTDTRSAWSNNKDIPMRLNEVDLPNIDWQWIDDWNVDCSSSTISVDSEGWSYALHFNSSEWYPKPSPLTYVRRRRWKRTRKCKDTVKDNDNVQATFSELYSIPKMSKSFENIDEFNIIVKQGFLEKQGAFIQNWKKRFFVLQKGSLSYYAKEDDLSPKGIISLVKCYCFSFQEAKRDQLALPFSFVGYSENDLETGALIVKTVNRNYLILCNSAREKEDWISAINSCIL